ncbi:TRAP transporter small permease [Rubrimonas cliftonensis]|uniref:TRAP transporter small permease n=1 Tax=Rubrimonas cliftonensis TaxID=89524 RepID=UPI001FDF732D|nr:TRAP transporter small permease subunit [Rubrimonas cliftonensis]
MLRLSDGAVGLLDWSGRLIAVSCLGVMFAALLTNVVLRYAFGSGIAWAYEIHALLLPWLVAGGVVIAAARGRNITVTLVPELAGAGTARLLAIAAQLAVLAICLGVLQSSRPILKAAQFQTLSTLGVRQIWGYASLVYAFGGMGVIAALTALRLVAGGDAPLRDPARASLS